MNTANTPTAQRLMQQRYGDPRTKGWESRWMMLWPVKKEFAWFPADRLYVHKDFQPLLEAAFTELERTGLHREIKTCAGCFAIRTVRGSHAHLSIHSWGAAIDLNAADNPLGSAGEWSSEFLAVMRRAGLYCGADWKGRKDPMHFAMVNG